MYLTNKKNPFFSSIHIRITTDRSSYTKSHSTRFKSKIRMPFRLRRRIIIFGEMVQGWQRILSIRPSWHATSSSVCIARCYSWCRCWLFFFLLCFRSLRLSPTFAHHFKFLIFFFFRHTVAQFNRQCGGSGVREFVNNWTLSMWSFWWSTIISNCFWSWRHDCRW